jgi:hypothetical protein
LAPLRRLVTRVGHGDVAELEPADGTKGDRARLGIRILRDHAQKATRARARKQDVDARGRGAPNARIAASQALLEIVRHDALRRCVEPEHFELGNLPAPSPEEPFDFCAIARRVDEQRFQIDEELAEALHDEEGVSRPSATFSSEEKPREMLDVSCFFIVFQCET